MSCDITVLAGTQPAIQAAFRNTAGDLTDPTAITVTTQSPAGVLTVYTYPAAPEIVKYVTDEPVGVWQFVFPAALTESGTWLVKFAGTAGVLAVAEASISVKRTKVA